MEVLEVRANLKGPLDEPVVVVFRFADGNLEFPNPVRLDSTLSVPISAFAGAVYEGPGAMTKPSVEMAFVHPERHLKERGDCIWHLPHEESATQLAEELNAACVQAGTAADAIVAGDRVVVVRDGRIHVSIHSLATGNWKASKEYALADVAGVRRLRGRLDIDLESGKGVRLATGNRDQIDRLSDVLLAGVGGSAERANHLESTSKVTEIERIASLYERGLLSDEEFTQMKKSILGSFS